MRIYETTGEPMDSPVGSVIILCKPLRLMIKSQVYRIQKYKEIDINFLTCLLREKKNFFQRAFSIYADIRA